MTDPTSVYNVYNYTGSSIRFTVSDSSKTYGVQTLGVIAPSGSAPTSITVTGSYDLFSFVGQQYYGQFGANYLANQTGGIDGFDYNNITFIVGVSPNKLIDSSGKTVVPSVPGIAYTVYLEKYSKSFIKTAKDKLKSQVDTTVSMMNHHFGMLILLIILAAVAVAVAYYFYHKRNA